MVWNYLYKVFRKFCFDVYWLNLDPSIFLLDPVNVTNYTAGMAQFSCLASGIPLPSIVWMKDNVVLSTNDRIIVNNMTSITQNERNITSVLTINDLLLSDTGLYHCTSSNTKADGNSVFGAISKAAFLFVQCKCINLHAELYIV